mmetsp:Transcript_31515/g.62296  ORF Transcript_31515/g.62296 Transcript_31515/m.62296 type:complete len:202 (-) Transcript_31515:1862-2467(-)
MQGVRDVGLSSVPSDDWFCPECRLAKHQESSLKEIKAKITSRKGKKTTAADRENPPSSFSEESPPKRLDRLGAAPLPSSAQQKVHSPCPRETGIMLTPALPFTSMPRAAPTQQHVEEPMSRMPDIRPPKRLGSEWLLSREFSQINSRTPMLPARLPPSVGPASPASTLNQFHTSKGKHKRSKGGDVHFLVEPQACKIVKKE